MSCHYVRVCEDTGEEPIELPVEEDNTLLLSTVAAQFPGVSGLKFEIESNFRGVKLCEGRLYPPDGFWNKILYYCVFPKGKTLCSAVLNKKCKSCDDQHIQIFLFRK